MNADILKKTAFFWLTFSGIYRSNADSFGLI